MDAKKSGAICITHSSGGGVIGKSSEDRVKSGSGRPLGVMEASIGLFSPVKRPSPAPSLPPPVSMIINPPPASAPNPLDGPDGGPGVRPSPEGMLGTGGSSGGLEETEELDSSRLVLDVGVLGSEVLGVFGDFFRFVRFERESFEGITKKGEK